MGFIFCILFAFCFVIEFPKKLRVLCLISKCASGTLICFIFFKSSFQLTSFVSLCAAFQIAVASKDHSRMLPVLEYDSFRTTVSFLLKEGTYETASSLMIFLWFTIEVSTVYIYFIPFSFFAPVFQILSYSILPKSLAASMFFHSLFYAYILYLPFTISVT